MPSVRPVLGAELGYSTGRAVGITAGICYATFQLYVAVGAVCFFSTLALAEFLAPERDLTPLGGSLWLPFFLLPAPAMGIPVIYWLCLIRLRTREAKRVRKEMLVFNAAAAAVFAVAVFLAMRTLYRVEYSHPSVQPLIVAMWAVYLVCAVACGLLAGLIGVWLADTFAQWDIIRPRLAAATPARTLAASPLGLGWILVAHLIFGAGVVIVVYDFGTLFAQFLPAFAFFVVMFWPYVLFAWAGYASWRTLRLLRRSIPAPIMPGVPLM